MKFAISTPVPRVFSLFWMAMSLDPIASPENLQENTNPYNT